MIRQPSGTTQRLVAAKGRSRTLLDCQTKKSSTKQCYGCKRFTTTPFSPLPPQCHQCHAHSRRIALQLRQHLKSLGQISLDLYIIYKQRKKSKGKAYLLSRAPDTSRITIKPGNRQVRPVFEASDSSAKQTATDNLL